MDELTLTALKASIAKWERNLEAETPDGVKVAAEDCPLCEMFIHNECEDCPVSKKSGYQFCRRTPYMRVTELRRDWMRGEKTQEDLQPLIQDEVDFLKSLLPVEAYNA